MTKIPNADQFRQSAPGALGVSADKADIQRPVVVVIKHRNGQTTSGFAEGNLREAIRRQVAASLPTVGVWSGAARGTGWKPRGRYF
jgi:hypothetical protein